MFKDKKLLFLIGVLFIYSLLASFDSPILLWDENSYLATAKNILGICPYSESFRFPLLYYLLALLIFIFGYNILLIKFILILIFSVSIYFFLKLLEENYPNSWKNYLLTLFLVLNGLLVFWAHRIYPDVLAMSLSIISMYFYYKHYNKKERKYLILLSLFAVLAFLAKFYYGLLFFVFLLFLRKKDRLLFILYTFLFLSPWLLYNFILYGNPLWNLIEQAKLAYMWQKSEPLIKFIENIFNYIGFLIIPIFLPKYLSKKEYPIYVYIILNLIYFAFFVKMKDPRYLLTILPFLIILARATIDKIPSTMLILFLLYGFSTGYSFLKGISENIKYNLCWDGTDIISFSLYYLKKKNASVVLSNCCWVWIANYLNIRAYSMHDKNVTHLIEKYNPDFIVYSPTYGLNITYNFPELEKEVEYEDNCENKVIIYRVK